MTASTANNTGDAIRYCVLSRSLINNEYLGRMMSSKLNEAESRRVDRMQAPLGLMAFSCAIRDWLYSEVADPGTHIDSGMGKGGLDLWVTVGGQEFLITISQAR